jgi:tetrahydromethanopterin S-methyltransferase subunit F
VTGDRQFLCLAAASVAGVVCGVVVVIVLLFL